MQLALPLAGIRIRYCDQRLPPLLTTAMANLVDIDMAVLSAIARVEPDLWPLIGNIAGRSTSSRGVDRSCSEVGRVAVLPPRRSAR